MSDTSEDGIEITFSVKWYHYLVCDLQFLGRVEVVRPDGQQVLDEALQSLKSKTTDKYSSEKAAKKSKVHIFLSVSGIDILENKTKFLLYTCPLSTVSFCAVLSSSPKVFGFVAKHPVADTYHCYLFQSKKFGHVLVSIIGDTFRASDNEESDRRGRDLLVEALRHKNKMLQKENAELKRRLAAQMN